MLSNKLLAAKHATIFTWFLAFALWALGLRFSNVALQVSAIVVSIAAAVMLFVVCYFLIVNQHRVEKKAKRVLRRTVLRKPKKKEKKIIRRIVFITFACGICAFQSCCLVTDYISRPYLKIDNQVWAEGKIEDKYAKAFLPAYEEVSGNTGYTFYVNNNHDYRPFSHRGDQFEKAYLLEITYSAETFQSNLEETLSKHEFWEEPNVLNRIPCASGTIGDYTFKVEKKSTPYMVAWNENEYKIRYFFIHPYHYHGCSSEESYLGYVKNTFPVDW